MHREKLGTRLGFLFLSASCAIGIGNVWKFPYVCGHNGGAIFLLFYLFFLFVLAIPILTMEFSVGRGAERSPIKMFNALQRPGQKWSAHGVVCLASAYLLSSYYTTVVGWILYYGYSYLVGDPALVAGEGATPSPGAFFGATVSSAPICITGVVLAIVAAFGVLSVGLQKGLEPVAKYMTGALLVMMLALVCYAVSLKDDASGLAFYLRPNVAAVKEVGFWNVVSAAMAQVFFSLGLGIGSMAVFGSYIGKERTLLGESALVGTLDTMVAFCAGLIIFPACSAYGVDPNSGPGLLFVTLPDVFNSLSHARWIGFAFFVFMTFAAFGTLLAIFECIVGSWRDITTLSRKTICLINIPLLCVLSAPSALGFNIWKNVRPFGADSTILDAEDFVLSNICVPLGALVFILFCVWKKGWGWDAFVAEANAGKGMKVRNRMRFYMTYILPFVVFFILIAGIVEKFK